MLFSGKLRSLYLVRRSERERERERDPSSGETELSLTLQCPFLSFLRQSLRLMIDDGSAIGIVVVWREGSDNVLCGIGVDGLVLGEFLSVRGRLDRSHGSCEIIAMRVVSWADPNAELAWWLDVVDAHEKVYFKPAPPVPLDQRPG
jgi:hypothetical protein